MWMRTARRMHSSPDGSQWEGFIRDWGYSWEIDLAFSLDKTEICSFINSCRTESPFLFFKNDSLYCKCGSQAQFCMTDAILPLLSFHWSQNPDFWAVAVLLGPRAFLSSTLLFSSALGFQNMPEWCLSHLEKWCQTACGYHIAGIWEHELDKREAEFHL